MTPALWMLVASAALTWALLLGGFPYALSRGWAWVVGTREDPPTPTGWHGRIRRAAANMYENLPLFTVLVVVAHLSGHGRDALTTLGAETFFAARVVHAIVYVAGVPYVRTAAWGASIAGMSLVGAALV